MSENDKIEVYSFNTGWINGKTCDDCGEVFNEAVECRIEGEYSIFCSECFSKIKGEVIEL